ncbi:MAG TPA: hypothetical protein VGM73_16300 [Candidatus Didemnitutus sp.]|jgi:hypothetical protein
MDDQKPATDGNEQGLNKIDLTQLQDFTFGTQWTEIKQLPASRRDRDGDRGDRRDDRGPAGEPKRDRRSFRKPAPGPAAPGAPGAPADRPLENRAPYRDRPPGSEPRPFHEGGFRGGPRRDFRGGEGYRGDWRERGDGPAPERGPYISPYFTTTCYPEDVGFAAMVKAIRASCRTFQLFEITKAVLEKNERFVVVIQRKTEGAPTRDSAPAVETKPVDSRATAKPAPLFMSIPDHLPFETEDAAIQHVLKNHLGLFFEVQEVEIDPPKGNFPIINKCGITGELLGPPNYHRYQQILQQHHAAKLARMPFEKFRDGIVSVREPEVAQQWLDKMKKATRYTWKTPAAKPASESNPPVAVEPAAPAPESTEAAPAPVPAPEPVSTPAAPAVTFDSFEEARAYLLANARDKAVRAVDTVRFHGKLIEKLPPGEARRAVEGHVERQRRFPLDTANALRGRLRREGFTIFKKGSRGVSYVCAVKRRFRVPGQVFSESIMSLIDYVEKNPMMPVKDLPLKFLGIDVAAAIAAHPAPEGTTASQAPFSALPVEQSERLRKMNNDLRWLVMEGYMTEFSDSKLFAPPAVVPQANRKAEDAGEEHDPVDFPEAPATPPADSPAPTAETPAVEAPVAEPPAPEAPAPISETPAVEEPVVEPPAPETPAGGPEVIASSEPVAESSPPVVPPASEPPSIAPA